MPKKIEVHIVGDSRSAEQSFRRAGNAASNFGSMAKKAAGISLAAGATLATVGGYAIKAAVDFESSFAGVRKTVNASEAEFAKLSKGFLDLSRRIPVNVNALNEIGEAAGQLGVQKKSILKFAEVIAKLGVSSNLAGEEGAAMLARFANITRMPQGQFDRLGATIVALGNAGASTEKEIAEMALRLGAAGSQVGMTQPQILGLANALSSVGVEAEAGGTAMSTSMIRIEEAVRGGGKQLAAFARVAGTSAEQFAANWRKNPSAALADFIEGLDRVKQEGGNVFATLDDLALGGIRVRDALLRSAGAGDLLRKSLQMGEKAWKENLALNKEAEQRFKTTASQLQLLKNNVNAYAIVWGAKLLPAINSVILAAGSFVRKFAEAKGMDAKIKVVWEGLEAGGRVLTEKIAAAVAAIDWNAAWSKAQGIGDGLSERFKAVDWKSVGKTIGDGIASGISIGGTLGKKLADSVMEASRSIDWNKFGRAMGPGLAVAMLAAFATVADLGFWIRNWDLVFAIAATAFSGPLGKLGTKLIAPLRKLGGDLVMSILAGIEQKAPFIASVLLSAITKLPGLVSGVLGKLAGVVGAQFGRLGRLARFTFKVLGIQAAINAVVDLASGIWSAIKGLPGKMEQVGRDIPSGIARGIYARGAAAVKAAIDWLSGMIPGWAKKMLGIGSPSRVMAEQVGWPIGTGIAAGILKSAPSTMAALVSMTRGLAAAGLKEVNALQGQLSAITARREAEDRAAAVRQATAALAEAQKKKEGVAAAELALARAREDIVVAGLNKQLTKEQALYDKRQTMIQTKMDKLNAAVQKAQDKASAIFDRMQGKIMQAFGAVRGSVLTPAEQALAAISDRRRQEDLNRAVDDAQKSLTEAMKGDDQDAILGARQTLARAQEDIQAASLERQASAERTAWDQQTAAMTEALTDKLAGMATTWKGGTDKIVSLLEGYGVDFATVGVELGASFRRSLCAVGVPT